MIQCENNIPSDQNHGCQCRRPPKQGLNASKCMRRCQIRGVISSIKKITTHNMPHHSQTINIHWHSSNKPQPLFHVIKTSTKRDINYATKGGCTTSRFTNQNHETIIQVKPYEHMQTCPTTNSLCQGAIINQQYLRKLLDDGYPSS